MSKLSERLFLFFLGIPLFIATILLVPHFHYIIFQIEIIFFSILAIIEMRIMLSKKMAVYSTIQMVIAGIITPLTAVCCAVFSISFRFIFFAMALSAIVILFYEFICSFSGQFEKSLERISSGFLVIYYPGFFVLFLSIMTVWEHAGILFCIFFLMVFGCDSIAWLLGILFGKGNRGFVPASPNKSLVGFAGGYAGSIGGSLAGYFLFPEVFSGPIWKMFLLAFFIATAAIIGDIAESILKRAAGIKDSGSFMPGRGGILDSIDSVLLSAPVFYILCDILFGFEVL